MLYSVLNSVLRFTQAASFLSFNRRGPINSAAVQQWPGNNFPNFRLVEQKVKLDELANSLKDEYSIPEITFGMEGIKKKHKQSVFNERRRSQKKKRFIMFW